MSEYVVDSNSLRRWIEQNPDASNEELLNFVEEHSKRFFLPWDATDIDEVCSLTEEESTALTDETRLQVMETFERRADFSCSVSNEDLREAFKDVLRRP
jgi:hypothetical protein